MSLENRKVWLSHVKWHQAWNNVMPTQSSYIHYYVDILDYYCFILTFFHNATLNLHKIIEQLSLISLYGHAIFKQFTGERKIVNIRMIKRIIFQIIFFGMGNFRINFIYKIQNCVQEVCCMKKFKIIQLQLFYWFCNVFDVLIKFFFFKFCATLLVEWK